MTEQYYSDEALRKQAAADELLAAGERIPLDTMVGIFESRVKPTEAEQCANCGGDGRDAAGGASIHGKSWCGLCIDRGRPQQRCSTADAEVARLREVLDRLGKVRDYCDQIAASVALCRNRGDGMCSLCRARDRIVGDIRLLLPSLPSVGGEVDQMRDDREYPGGSDNTN